MGAADDLTGLLTQLTKADTDIGYRSGIVTAWNAETGENTITIAGAPIVNTPFLIRTEALAIRVGDVVGLLRVRSQYFVLGRISVNAGEIVVRDNDGAILSSLSRDGLTVEQGAVTVRDGIGEIRSEYGFDDVLARLWVGQLEWSTLSTPAAAPHARLRYVPPILDRIEFEALNNTAMSIWTNNGPLRISSFGTGQNIYLDAGTNGEVRVTSGTTAAAANVRLDSFSAALQRSTSSRRYKTDISAFRVDPRAVLDLDPVTYRDRGEVERDPDTNRWHVGFLAEDLDEAGLSAFVDYTDDGEPDAITYDRLSVALLEVVKDQQRRLDDLTAWAKQHGFTPRGDVDPEPTRLPQRTPITADDD